MINRIIAFIIALIVLALAGEGGYVLGINAGKRIGAQETLKKQSQQKLPEQPSSSIPVIDKTASQWVEQVNGLPLNSFWSSNWQMTIGGNFVSMDNKSIVLEINNERKTLIFPIEITKINNVQFSQYNVSNKEHIPKSLKMEDLRLGDSVGVDININTFTGQIGFLEITKQIGQQPFN